MWFAYSRWVISAKVPGCVLGANAAISSLQLADHQEPGDLCQPQAALGVEAHSEAGGVRSSQTTWPRFPGRLSSCQTEAVPATPRPLSSVLAAVPSARPPCHFPSPGAVSALAPPGPAPGLQVCCPVSSLVPPSLHAELQSPVPHPSPSCPPRACRWLQQGLACPGRQ